MSVFINVRLQDRVLAKWLTNAVRSNYSIKDYAQLRIRSVWQAAQIENTFIHPTLHPLPPCSIDQQLPRRQIALDINLPGKAFVLLRLLWQLWPQLQQNPIRMPFWPAFCALPRPSTYPAPRLPAIPRFTTESVFAVCHKRNCLKLLPFWLLFVVLSTDSYQIQYHPLAAKISPGAALPCVDQLCNAKSMKPACRMLHAACHTCFQQ